MYCKQTSVYVCAVWAKHAKRAFLKWAASLTVREFFAGIQYTHTTITPQQTLKHIHTQKKNHRAVDSLELLRLALRAYCVSCANSRNCICIDQSEKKNVCSNDCIATFKLAWEYAYNRNAMMTGARLER